MSNLMSYDDVLDEHRRTTQIPGYQTPDTAMPRFFREAVPRKKWHDPDDPEAGYTTTYREMDLVEVIIPGDSKTMPVMRVTEQHKRRWPRQWEAFQNSTSTAPVEGTRLEDCGIFRTPWVAALKAMNCHTVEAFLNMPTEGFLKLPPIEHPGGAAGLRADAEKWLNHEKFALAKDERIAEQSEKLALQDSQIKELMAKVDKLAKAGRKPRPRPKAKRTAALKPEKGEGDGNTQELEPAQA